MKTKSLEELMIEAGNLSLKVAYETIAPGGYYFDAREVDLPDAVWSWADDLMHRYYEKITTGCCSLQATIDFDVTEFEQEVLADISLFKALLEKHGMPRVLTFSEMRSRGYTGSWAGMDKEGNIVHE